MAAERTAQKSIQQVEYTPLVISGEQVGIHPGEYDIRTQAEYDQKTNGVQDPDP